MNKNLKLIVASIFISIFMTESVMARGSMRCGTHMVTSDPAGPSGKYEVLKRCGEPTERYGDTWIYVRGSVTTTLEFSSNGQLRNIYR
jgi:hypothetical protein